MIRNEVKEEALGSSLSFHRRPPFLTGAGGCEPTVPCPEGLGTIPVAADNREKPRLGCSSIPDFSHRANESQYCDIMQYCATVCGTPELQQSRQSWSYHYYSTRAQPIRL